MDIKFTNSTLGIFYNVAKSVMQVESSQYLSERISHDHAQYHQDCHING
jgi:hypothetical protein